MRILLFSFLLTFCLSANLQNEYKIQGNEIYSDHILKNTPKFFIASFGNAFEFKIASKDLIALFKRYGINLEGSGEVRFVYQTPKRFLDLQNQVKSYFLQAYPSLKIKEIYLKPLSQTASKNFQASLTPSILKKNKFEFFAQSDGKEGGVVFLCGILGEIEVFVANGDIRSRQEFNRANTKKQIIPFKGFFQEPAVKDEIFQSQAKGFIKNTQIITRTKLAPKTLVQRGEMIDVVFQENGVKIETRLEAQKNGSLGEIITAKNLESKKIVKVKVIAQGKGEVL